MAVALPFLLAIVGSVAILVLAATHGTEGEPASEDAATAPDPHFRHELEKRLQSLAPVLGALIATGLCFACALVSRRFRRWLLPPPRRAPAVPWGLLELGQVGAIAFVLLLLSRFVVLGLGHTGALRIVTYVLPQLALALSLQILWLSAAFPLFRGAGRTDVIGSLGLSVAESRRNVLRGGAGYVILLPLSAAVANVAEYLSTVLDLSTPVHPVIEEIATTAPAETVALVLTAALLAPVVEEVFFRGFVYATIRESLGAPVGMIVSALLFASVHSGLPNQAVTCVMGIFLAAIYERSGSLVAPMIIHALFNGVQMAMVLMAFGAG